MIKLCGRYAFYIEKNSLALRYNIDLKDNLTFSPRPEIYPGENSPVLVNKSNNKQLKLFNWGFTPSYAKYRIINAKAESIDKKATFKDAFYNKRCIIPATSFYEWKDQGKRKVKHQISIKDQDIFSMAGIYDDFIDENGNIVTSFSIITTKANDKMNNLHHRMPVILTKNKENYWLNNNDISKLKNLLKPYNNEDTIIERDSNEEQLSLF